MKVVVTFVGRGFYDEGGHVEEFRELLLKFYFSFWVTGAERGH